MQSMLQFLLTVFAMIHTVFSDKVRKERWASACRHNNMKKIFKTVLLTVILTICSMAPVSAAEKESATADDYYIYDRTVTVEAAYNRNYQAERQGWQVYIQFKRVPTKEDVEHGLTETIETMYPMTEYSDYIGRWQQDFSVKSGYYNIFGIAISPNGKGYKLIPNSTTPQEADNFLIDVSMISSILLVTSGEEISVQGWDDGENIETPKPVEDIINEMQGYTNTDERVSGASVPGEEKNTSVPEKEETAQTEDTKEKGTFSISDYIFAGSLLAACVGAAVFKIKGKL